jgi:hypothetical protein
MPRWSQEIADAVLFDIRYGLNLRLARGPGRQPIRRSSWWRAPSSSVCSKRTGSLSEDHPRRWAARQKPMVGRSTIEGSSATTPG